MKYICIKEFNHLPSKVSFKFKFMLNDKISDVKITNMEGARDKRVSFLFEKNHSYICNFYMPARKFFKHFKSEGKLREDRINEIFMA